MATTLPQLQTVAAEPPAAPRSLKAMAAALLGVAAVVAVLLPLLGIALGVVAISVGAVARVEQRERVVARGSRWAATAGLAFGAIAVAAGIGLFIVSTASA